MKNEPMKASVTFHEVQQFRQKWIWILMLFILGVVIGTLGYGMITQLVFGNPWGDEPMSDTLLSIVGSLVILLVIVLVYAFYKMKMVTEVYSDSVRVQFMPFVNRRIPVSEIESFEAKRYSPILEYGGWGVRWMPGRGMAYNVSGNSGVLLTLTNGKTVMIGSRRAEELADAMTTSRLNS
jgi:hypothetical protein